MSRWIAMLGAVALLAACSGTKTQMIASNAYPPTTGPVLVVKGPLPQTVKYEPIAQVQVARGRYGKADLALRMLANQARALGCDAVIEVNTWFAPSMGGWATPHAQGKAVRITNRDSAGDLSAVGLTF